MKKIRIYILIILLPFFMVACNLDRFPETDLSDANFWKSDDNFKQACNVFYTLVDGENDIFFDDMRSDYAFDFANGANAISSGTRVASATSTDWIKSYQMIFDANKIIEKAETAESAKNIKQWIGEAKFWRAYAYYRLLTRFGDVPLVLKTLDVDSPELYGPRTDRALVVGQIYDDLDYATENLPSFSALGAANYGRTSKSAALALKARVALYEGTRQKFHGYGNPSSDLSVAVSAAEAIMAEGHALFKATTTPYFSQFQYVGEGYSNKENILSVIYGVNDAQILRKNNITGLIQNGWYCVTRPLIEQYLCTDGLPYDRSPLAEYPETGFASMFKNKDPRLDASIIKEGDDYTVPSVYPAIPPQRIGTAYAARKYFIYNDPWQQSRSFIDISIIRYAEILLIYAEAKYELSGSITDADLDKSINLLRDRVAMPRLTNQFVTDHDLDMRTEIRRERNVELAQEGFRYDDINRWKIAEEVLPKAMIGAKYFPDFGGGWNISDDGYLEVQRANTRFFDPQKDYLYPVPTKDIALSGGKITQNPNW
ncbi:MAG: RagB/SusD family nutrient uptake outer membrane protein [Chitinophagaceae bacterium]|nr:RagB/SusD family nutrient uptake outer membrane protein [Chitinophagaceae bacterium]